jgi:hypothetical protein
MNELSERIDKLGEKIKVKDDIFQDINEKLENSIRLIDDLKETNVDDVLKIRFCYVLLKYFF